MNIHLKALGCRLNEAEIENWAEQFRDLGHSICNDPRTADLVIVNTCAVTNEAAKKSRQLIRRSRRLNPSSKLILAGCYASLEPGLNKTISGIDLLVTNDKKDMLVDIVNRKLLTDVIPPKKSNIEELPLFRRGRNRAFIKIQDGCRHRCTFCIVTVARGPERSRETGGIIEQINRLSRHGVKEVVLTGVHVGGYGSDLGTNLHDLLKNILSRTDIPRIRLASVEPWDLHENFFELFADPRLMPHMHLPLQCGDDEILKRMGRRCNTENYLSLVTKARDLVPDFNITTDIIVGFPGETHEHWQRGLAFIREIGFSHIHIFPFSPRAGTAAAVMPGRVPDTVRQERCRQLQDTASRIREDYLAGQFGRMFPVLFENSSVNRKTGITEYSGYTPNYIRVKLARPAYDVPIQNEIRKVKITRLTAPRDALTGDLVSFN